MCVCVRVCVQRAAVVARCFHKQIRKPEYLTVLLPPFLPCLSPASWCVSPSSSYLTEFSRRRSAWHASRRGRKEAMVYGSALLVFVLFIDDVLKMV